MTRPGVDSVWVRLGDHSDHDNSAEVMANTGVESDLIELGGQNDSDVGTVAATRSEQRREQLQTQDNMRMCGCGTYVPFWYGK